MVASPDEGNGTRFWSFSERPGWFCVGTEILDCFLGLLCGGVVGRALSMGLSGMVTNAEVQRDDADEEQAIVDDESECNSFRFLCTLLNFNYCYTNPKAFTSKF